MGELDSNDYADRIYNRRTNRAVGQNFRATVDDFTLLVIFIHSSILKYIFNDEDPSRFQHHYLEFLRFFLYIVR